MKFGERAVSMLKLLLSEKHTASAAIFIVMDEYVSSVVVSGREEEVKNMLKAILFSEQFQPLLYQIAEERFKEHSGDYQTLFEDIIKQARKKFGHLKGMDAEFSEQADDSIFNHSAFNICEN